MSPNLRIAYRFLTAKKRAMLMSLSCTVLGVGLFIVTQATTSGFEKFFIRTLLATDGALRVEDRTQDPMRSSTAPGGSDFRVRQKEGVKYVEGVEYPRQVIETLRQFSNVRGASAVLRGSVTVTSSFRTQDAQVLGINIEDHIRVSAFEQQITAGDLNQFRQSPTGAVVGRVIADALQLTVGDWFNITARGETRRYRVAAINETGVRDFDKVRIYLSFAEARSLLKRPNGASYVQVSLFDPGRAEADAERMSDVLNHMVTPWQKREKVWLDVFWALRLSSGITVTVFTLIAGLAMFNTLLMIVIEKTKDIAILRSMGYARADITQVFLWQAGIVLTMGCMVGALFGTAVSYGISRVPLSISGIFKASTYQVDLLNPAHYVEAIVTAVIMVMIASLVPARRAARLEPGDIVRGTAQ